MDDVKLVDVPPLQVTGIKRRGLYRIISDFIGELFGFVMVKRGHHRRDAYAAFTWDIKEEAMEADRSGKAKVEVIVPIAGRVCSEGEVLLSTLPGGKMARVVHFGPYETVGGSSERLFSWIEKKGLRVSGPVREIYHNNPQEVKPEAVKTEILVPVD
jgi:AraC family transcriptional regulator